MEWRSGDNATISSWLHLSDDNNTLSGVPSSGDRGTHDVFIRATNNETEVNEVRFELEVLNNKPTVQTEIQPYSVYSNTW